MLILQRKPGESLLIGEEISISILSVEGGRVRLAISAPQEVPILRSELLAAREEAAPAELLGLLEGIPKRSFPPEAPQPPKK